MSRITDRSEDILDFKIDFAYEGKKGKTLDNVKGTISKGQCVVLCGESGCGKSTLLRCLNHLIPEFYEGVFKGCILVNGQNIGKKNIGEVGELVSSVFQDPRSQFFTMESETEISFGLENKGISHEAIRKRTQDAFSKFGLEYLKNREVFKLSSGERQLIAIMAAWAMDTDIILLDEPTANLDYLAIEKLKNILLLLKEDGKTLIISEHRLYYLKELADEYWLIKNGSFYEKYDKDDFKIFSKDELNNLCLRVTDLKQIEVQKKCSNVVNYKLEVKNISFGYKKQHIINDLSFTAYLGEVTCLIGKNGSGKTTLGKCICGLLKPKKGRVFLKEKELSQRRLSQESLFIMQEAEFQFFTNSVLSELEYGVNRNKYDEIEALLNRFDMWKYRDRHPFSLSGGQMQKLTLMMAYLSDKSVVILDEPTSGMDKRSLDTVVGLINDMKKKKIVIIISHDLEFISAVADKCLEIDDGAIQRICEVKENRDIETIKSIFEKELEHQSPPEREKNLLDSRTNILFWLLCMIAVGIDNKSLIFECNLLALVFSLANRRYKTFGITSVITGLIYGLEIIYPNEITMFAANLFPRFILIFLLFPIILGGRGATNMLAGLRKIRIPEKLLLIFAVSFRFFPVLRNDFKLLRQVLRNRGSCKHKNIIKEKLEYIEALIVSLIFRVIRIGETLSASAETRGIALNHKKSSYVTLRFHLCDYILMMGMIVILMINIL
ncbi:energy-coupling factor transport system ATP-binding protein [Peptostreptococcaceae bacterium pGA-8]|nr:energy-coupling factor transport system ATP-binding protein [Peptostreptococcaceae bacterium pGA-8]